MHPLVYNCLEELTKAGATKLPRAQTIEEGGNGKTWSGKTEDGKIWIITKKNEDDYSCQCKQPKANEKTA